MKIIIVALLFSTLMISASAQNKKIKEADLSFKLPNEKWELKDSQKANGKVVYFYKREPIIDSKNRSIIPNISFIIEDVDKSTDVVLYSAQKRLSAPFDVKEVFTYEDSLINYKNAIGYKGIYSDKNGIEHTVFVIHLINEDKGVQIFFDITTELFSEYEDEFITTMQSINKK